MNSLTHNNKKYNYFFGNLYQLTDIFKLNIKLTQSFNTILALHRNVESFNYSRILFDEDLQEYYKNKSESYYFIIYDKNNIVTTSRIIINKNNGYINMVHTNIKYRGHGFCNKNISKLISITNVKQYTLNVLINNEHAVKCYLSCGFTIIKMNKQEYTMRFIN